MSKKNNALRDLTLKKSEFKQCHKPVSIKKLKQQATEWLRREKLSPELIRSRWSVQGMGGVSHETIYRWICQGKVRKDLDIADLYKHLKHGRRRCKWGNDNDSRGIFTDRATLLTRLKKVDTRNQPSIARTLGKDKEDKSG